MTVQIFLSLYNRKKKSRGSHLDENTRQAIIELAEKLGR